MVLRSVEGFQTGRKACVEFRNHDHGRREGGSEIIPATVEVPTAAVVRDLEVLSRRRRRRRRRMKRSHGYGGGSNLALGFATKLRSRRFAEIALEIDKLCRLSSRAETRAGRIRVRIRIRIRISEAEQLKNPAGGSKAAILVLLLLRKGRMQRRSRLRGWTDYQLGALRAILSLCFFLPKERDRLIASCRSETKSGPQAVSSNAWRGWTPPPLRDLGGTGSGATRRTGSQRRNRSCAFLRCDSHTEAPVAVWPTMDSSCLRNQRKSELGVRARYALI